MRQGSECLGRRCVEHHSRGSDYIYGIEPLEEILESYIPEYERQPFYPER